MKAITKNMGWCNDPKSNKYNQLIKYPFVSMQKSFIGMIIFMTS